MVDMLDIARLLEENRGIINSSLKSFFKIPTDDPGQKSIFEAMEYSVNAGGKRIRPFIILKSAELHGVHIDDAMPLAIAVELIHTYSLVHDDLPSMDNADTRRGKPSVHIAFDDATAVLTGDALLTIAFQIISSEDYSIDPFAKCQIMSSLAASIGPMGMIAGQMLDMKLLFSDKSSDEEFVRMNRLKTGKLFEFCAMSGGLLAKANKDVLLRLERYGHDLGLIFQITDDILDTAEDTVMVSHERQMKYTFIKHLGGIEGARAHLPKLADQAIAHLDIFDSKANHLRELVSFISKRVS